MGGQGYHRGGTWNWLAGSRRNSLRMTIDAGVILRIEIEHRIGVHHIA
jgi:hypothetical protein